MSLIRHCLQANRISLDNAKDWKNLMIHDFNDFRQDLPLDTMMQSALNDEWRGKIAHLEDWIGEEVRKLANEFKRTAPEDLFDVRIE